jgi:hypothetical protein
MRFLPEGLHVSFYCTSRHSSILVTFLLSFNVSLYVLLWAIFCVVGLVLNYIFNPCLFPNCVFYRRTSSVGESVDSPRETSAAGPKSSSSGAGDSRPTSPLMLTEPVLTSDSLTGANDAPVATAVAAVAAPTSTDGSGSGREKAEGFHAKESVSSTNSTTDTADTSVTTKKDPGSSSHTAHDDDGDVAQVSMFEGSWETALATAEATLSASLSVVFGGGAGNSTNSSGILFYCNFTLFFGEEFILLIILFVLFFLFFLCYRA